MKDESMTFDEYIDEALKDIELKKEYDKLKRREVRIICPNCGSVIEFKNWFHWIWYCPFHWFGRRLVECDECGLQFYGKREK